MEWLIPILLSILAGIVLIVVEVFLPGIGIPGTMGGLLFLGGIALSWVKCPDAAGWISVGAAALLLVSVLLALRSAAKGKLSRSSVILRDPGQKNEAAEDLSIHVGKTGTVETVLRPVGVALLDDGTRVNVMAENGMIEKDARIRVTRVDNNHLFADKA